MRTVPYTKEQFHEWLTLAKVTRPIDKIFVHHFAIPSAKDWKGLPTLLSVKNEHIKRMDTYDIGYHFIIGPDDTIWLGRDINRIGAHAKYNNTGSVGIVFASNFDAEEPKDHGYDTGLFVISEIARKLGIIPAKIYGHREGKNSHTGCPGKLLDLDDLRYDVANYMNTKNYKVLVIDNYVVPSANAHIADDKLVANSKSLDRFFGWKTEGADKFVEIRPYLSKRGISVTGFGVDKLKNAYDIMTTHNEREHDGS